MPAVSFRSSAEPAPANVFAGTAPSANPKRVTPKVLLSQFGVAYAEGHVHARDRFEELVGWLRLPKSGKGY